MPQDKQFPQQPNDHPYEAFYGPQHRAHRSQRMAHWDAVSGRRSEASSGSRYYHRLLERYYRFLVPPGLKVLELGCGQGDLLAALDPDPGIGVDFSDEMLRQAAARYPKLKFVRADVHNLAVSGTFDVIILSDLVNDLWDVQHLFEEIRRRSHSHTRIILNFYNNLWRLPLEVVRFLGLGADTLTQNWFTPDDIYNLLNLSGFEVIKRQPGILFPLDLPALSVAANRYLAKIAPFCWFALTNFIVARPLQDPSPVDSRPEPSVSVVVPARNEAGNIDSIFTRLPQMGRTTELVFVEGHSKDSTYETIVKAKEHFGDMPCKVCRQTGTGKGDAVRLGFQQADGDILMILDADLTVPPENLVRFYDAIVSGKGEFINGVRLVYPLGNKSMRFFNMLGNKFFSLAFSWLLGQPLKDTLCGTKVLWRKDYQMVARNRAYFGDFDPFGDFDLLFGAAKLNLKITEIPIRYRSRTYGKTNIQRWRHGGLLIRMVAFAAKRIKFVS